MIKLLSRKECLERNLSLAASIQETQFLVYAPDKNDLLFNPGENYLEEEQKWVELTEEECQRRNRPIIEEFEKIRDKIPDAPELGAFKSQAILSTATKDFNEHRVLFSHGLNYLNEKLDWRGMLFILDYPFPWLSSLNEVRDKQVLNWLRKKGVHDDFKGGIYADGEDLKTWVSLLFKLKKDNVGFPDCSFAGVNSAAIGFICKHGNIHYVFYKDDEKTEFDKALEKLNLIDIPFGAC
ncbi:hypothetical protein NE848_11505 [Gramella jeungdoensis]|uniref:Histidine kinase n=1 Tax=Gramella jeungdoensis TaxID=708091 RepID=A0ABT0Z3A1_9FLAO|nr:hypothetical protein [Gramella jeungdoensis]MCM8570009.1 hypothetical protein [Gramella jeungdoensis]